MPRKRKTSKQSQCVPGAIYVSPKKPTARRKHFLPEESATRRNHVSHVESTARRNHVSEESAACQNHVSDEESTARQNHVSEESAARQNHVLPQESTAYLNHVASQESTARHNVFKKCANQGLPDVPVKARLEELPVELLYEIDDYLDKSNALAFRVTCGRIREALLQLRNRTRALHSFNTTRYGRHYAGFFLTRKRLHQKLIKDAIWAEENGRGHPGRMQVCGRCNTFHDKKCFSLQQLSTSPSLRACHAHERKFRLCKHHSMDYFELVDLPLDEGLRKYQGRSASLAARLAPTLHLNRRYSKWLGGPPCDCLVTIQTTFQLAEEDTEEFSPPYPVLHGWSMPRGRHIITCLLVEDEAVLNLCEQERQLADKLHDHLLGANFMICPHLQAGQFGMDWFMALTSDLKRQQWASAQVSGACGDKLCNARYSFHLSATEDLPKKSRRRRKLAKRAKRYTTRIKVSRQADVYDFWGPEWLAISEVFEQERAKASDQDDDDDVWNAFKELPQLWQY